MIDKQDTAILNILRKNSRLSVREIAKLSKIPPTTVSRRIRNLNKLGIIKNYTIDIDMYKVGRPTISYVFMNLDVSVFKIKKLTQNEIIERIMKHPVVEECCSVTGRVDVLAKVRTKDIFELDDFINYLRKEEAVLRTETLIALYYKGESKNI